MNIFTKRNLSILVLACGILVSGTLFASAQNISVNIPGTHGTDQGVPGIVANLYEFSLMIGVLLAFGVIVYAGIKYTVAVGNPSAQSDAKDHVFQALLGLLLLLGASIVLGTINPRLNRLFLPTLTPIHAPEPTAVVPSAVAETAARTALAGIIINNPPCPDGQTFQQFRLANNGRGCTSVVGLPPSTITRLLNLKRRCECSVEITGGTELGHTTHGPVRPIVDLRVIMVTTRGGFLGTGTRTSSPLGDYINANREALCIQAVCTTPADSHYSFNCPTNPETESHFHVVFAP